MWLVITKYYPIYEEGIAGKKFKIYEPQKVKDNTNDYKIGSDVYAEFLDENIEKTDDKKNVESMDSIAKLFKEWYTGSYSEKPPPKKNFIAYLKKNKYVIANQNVYGVRMRYSSTLA